MESRFLCREESEVCRSSSGQRAADWTFPLVFFHIRQVKTTAKILQEEEEAERRLSVPILRASRSLN